VYFPLKSASFISNLKKVSHAQMLVSLFRQYLAGLMTDITSSKKNLALSFSAFVPPQ